MIKGVSIFARRRVVFVNDEYDHYLTEMPQDYYTELDFALLKAYQFYLDSLCQKCGTPSWYGRTTNNQFDFKVQYSSCEGCRHLEEASEARSNSKAKHPKGETPYVVPVPLEMDPSLPPMEIPDPLELLKSVR